MWRALKRFAGRWDGAVALGGAAGLIGGYLPLEAAFLWLGVLAWIGAFRAMTMLAQRRLHLPTVSFGLTMAAAVTLCVWVPSAREFRTIRLGSRTVLASELVEAMEQKGLRWDPESRERIEALKFEFETRELTLHEVRKLLLEEHGLALKMGGCGNGASLLRGVESFGVLRVRELE